MAPHKKCLLIKYNTSSSESERTSAISLQHLPRPSTQRPMPGRSSHGFALCFNRHFPGGPGLAGTRMFPYWILLELRMMEVVVTTGVIRCAKLPS